MSKRDLLFSTILIALSFFSLFSLQKEKFSLSGDVANYQVEAACGYAALCDPSGTTCNGGAPCYIGNTICTGAGGSTYSNPICSGYRANDGACNCGNPNPWNPGNSGTSCGTPYAPGVCSCTIVNAGCTVVCTDTYWPTCGGATCGWGSYSSCSAACGTGSQSRYNSCTGVSQTQTCNTTPCPSPVASPGASPVPTPPLCSYGAWGPCSQACGGGTRSRSDSCGNTQIESCNTQECTCTVGPWSPCSGTCGNGTQTRNNNCIPGSIETLSCNTCTLGCSCSVSCGQSTDCGTCSSISLGQTPLVTLNPQSGNLVMPANRSVTVNWTASTGAENYDVQIYPTGTTPGAECTAPNTFCVTGTTSNSYTFTAPQGVPNYSWRVRTNNTTCNAVSYLTATASDEWLTGEGAPSNATANKAVDGSDVTDWNAGGYAPQWIELDLKSARAVSGMRMATSHFPNGLANIEIYAGATANPTTLVHTISQNIVVGDILNITFSSPVANVRYIRVRTTTDVSWTAWNELTPYYSDGVGNWTNGTFLLVGPMSGNIYLDQNGTATLNLATGLCQMGGALIGQNPGLISSIQARWGSSGTTNGSITGSTYTIPNVPNYNNIGATMSPDATSWRCTCPTGCSYSGQNVPISGVNYFLTNVANPWWQSQNGLVYAGATTGNALVSQIPVTCTGACIGNLSLRNALGVGESSGLVITGGGDIDADQDPTLRYGKLRQDTVQSRIIGSVYNGPRENYQYFYNLYSLGSAPISDFNGTQPGSGPANGRAYYAGSTQSINSAWLIPSGQKTVIFVNGNLNINNTITVDKGGFLSFIVNGNITVANTVGQGSPVAATSNVAAGKPSSQSSDYPLPNSQASRANDGNTNGDFTAGSVTHTLNDVNAWWQVDLGAAHNISSINVYNRTEANSARLTNYNVFVSDTPFTSTNLGTTLAQSGVSNYPNSGTAGSPSSSAVGRTGRYVRLQLNGTNYLSIAELQVVGNPVGSSGTITGNTPAVEGVYIADRIIIQGGLSGGDKKFVGAGTFVGWSGVTLGRSFADPLANDTNPSELFIFRPDFVQNVPERMTRPLYTWQETN